VADLGLSRGAPPLIIATRVREGPYSSLFDGWVYLIYTLTF